MQGAEKRQQQQSADAKRLRIRLTKQQAKGAHGAALNAAAVELEDDESRKSWHQQQGRGGEEGDVEQLAAIDEPAQQQREQPEKEEQRGGAGDDDDEEEEEQQQQGNEEGQEQEEQQQDEEEDDAEEQQQDEGDEAEGAEEQQGGDVSKSWPPGPSPYQQALASCRDLACLTAAGKLERYPGQFRFPHFFIIGWQVGGWVGAAGREGGRAGGRPAGLVLQALLGGAFRPPAAEVSSRIACTPASFLACCLPPSPLQKCATTSLYFHLRHHPQMRAAYDKVRARGLRVARTHGARCSCRGC